MENTQQQILSEIKALMASVRVQLEQLDAKMAELQQSYEPQDFESEPIDIELDAFPMEIDDDLPFVMVPSSEPEQPVEAETAPSSELQAEDEPQDMEPVMPAAQETVAEDEMLFAPLEEDLPPAVSTPASASPSAVIDVMTRKHAWRTDMPGTPVKDIRAAIALVDRALFINSLFAEDAMSFLETLNHINQVASLDEVVEYLAAAHPEWDFDSDVVYRFMMAVRRKIN